MSESLPASLRPNLLGIGAAKSGTTRFATLLSRHPDVFLPPQKELNCLHYEDLTERLSEYAAYFRDGEQARIRCDFSVRYLPSPRAHEAAARHLPDAKILAILRNPIDQVQSHYWHLRRQNFHQSTPVAKQPALFEAIEQFPELLLEPALYGKHLSRWMSLFPRSAFLVLDYDEVVSAPGPVMERVWRFLGLEPPSGVRLAPQAASGPERRGVQPRGGFAASIYPHVYTFLARGPFQILKRVIGVEHADHIKRSLRIREAAEAIFFQPGYPRLDAGGRQKLFGLFENDLEGLASLGVIDVRDWRPQ